MTAPISHNKFIFNEKIDGEFLYSLYEDDYPYIIEVFGTTLTHFEEDLEQIRQAYAERDMEALRKAVHKFKPIFGFSGLLTHQDMMGKFELSLKGDIALDTLADTYQSLMNAINEGKDIIEEEHKRLIQFTRSQS